MPLLPWSLDQLGFRELQSTRRDAFFRKAFRCCMADRGDRLIPLHELRAPAGCFPRPLGGEQKSIHALQMALSILSTCPVPMGE